MIDLDRLHQSYMEEANQPNSGRTFRMLVEVLQNVDFMDMNSDNMPTIQVTAHSQDYALALAEEAARLAKELEFETVKLRGPRLDVNGVCILFTRGKSCDEQSNQRFAYFTDHFVKEIGL